MMSYGDKEEEVDLHSSHEEMESLVLDDPPDGQSHGRNGQLSRPVMINYDPLLSSSPSYADRQSPDSPFDSFLEPPSYAEAIFTSFDSSSNGRDGSPDFSSTSNALSSEFLSISVSDPQRMDELNNSLVPGGSGYYTYLITTTTNLPEYGGPGSEFGVRRRFKDVVALSDRLLESYRGFFIPTRPDKNVVESQMMQKQEFVEQRRVALEKYLRKLALHPVIRKSEELRMFLEAKGSLPLVRSTDVASRMLDGAVKLPRQLFGEPAAAVDLQEVVKPAKGGRDLLRIFKELKQSMTNDWVGSKPMVVEEDKKFLEKKGKLMDIEQQLGEVSQQAESLVKAQQDIGETMGELGLAFVKLSKFETEEAMLESQRVRAADMKNLATVAVKASRLYRELNSQTVKHLDKLHDYLGVMLAVNGAFSDRVSALLTVQTLSSDLSSLHTRIERLEAASSKIFGGDRSRLRKIEELKDTLRITEDAKTRAVTEYDRIKENNRSELERLDREMQEDFTHMLKGFVLNQVGYAEKMANVWESLAEETRDYQKDHS
ncbi:sorting nexin 2B-like [Cucurbita pepo subsp. pepo]|uniref:sorting nexin 2B-like n=1 Tax=Cucurbita pepo subsp. pepo TaxID=3664 RepID=UPI000C9D291B|nr:sorting nexin 2B-like [Cucurbita pepo subsp. pepo]